MPASRLTRRKLLQRSGWLGLASILPTSAGGQAGVGSAANDRIEVVVIGLGSQGMKHLEDLLGFEQVRVVAVVDVDGAHRERAREKVAAAYGEADVAVYEDFRECLSQGRGDAAVIAVPNHWHAYIAIACLERGLDVYGETPLAHSVVEGRAICRAVSRYGRVWQSGNPLRSDALCQRACGLVTAGKLGVVRKVEVGTYGGTIDLTEKVPQGYAEGAAIEGFNYDLWLGPAPWRPYHPGLLHKNWVWHQDYGGGRLMSWVGRYVDIALWALGLENGGPIKVEATGQFSNHSLFNVPERYDLDALFFGDLKMRVSSSLAPGVRWFGNGGEWIYVSDRHLLASSPELLQAEESDEWATTRFAAHGQDHWGDFFSAMRSRRPAVATCESAQRAASVGHLGMLALNLGRPITWRPEKETIYEDPNAAGGLEVSYRKPWILLD